MPTFSAKQRALDVCAVPSTALELWAETKSAYHAAGRLFGSTTEKASALDSNLRKIQQRAEITPSLNDALLQRRRCQLAALYKEKKKEVKRSIKNDKRS